MKLKSISIYMLSLAGMLGLWSCSTDEAISGGGLVASGEKVPVTITISRGVQTRTELSENTTNGGLNQVWSEGDVVKLYNSNGAEAGTLTLKSGADTPDGIFKGNVEGETGTYRLWYFGKPQADAENPYPYLDFSTAGQVKLDLQNQNFKSLNDLEAVDILSTNVNIVVKNRQGTVGQTVTMNPHVAMARFKMSGIPESTSGTVKVYNNLNADRGQITARQSLLLSTGRQQDGYGTTTSFTYNGVKNGDDIYVAFLPNPYTLHFEFEASNGAKYTHTFGQNNIGAGVYYRSFNKEDEAETGTIEGIEVPMQLSEKYTLRYHANFEGAEPESFEDVQYKAPAVFTLKGYADTELPSREGYTFLGWANSASATQPDITGSSITLSEDDKNTPRDVYAVWEETKKSYNPGDMGSWGGPNIDPEATDIGVKFVSEVDGWTLNWRSVYNYGGFGTYIRFDHNGMINGHLTSKGGTSLYYQWGRWLGLPATCGNLDIHSQGSYKGGYKANSQLPLGVNYYNTKIGYIFANSLSAAHGRVYMGENSWTNERALRSSIMFGKVTYTISHGDYVNANEKCEWEDRCGNPAPTGYRIPTASELEVFIPTGGSINSSKVEVKTINGQKFAFQWKVIQKTSSSSAKLQIRSFKTNETTVSLNDSKFDSAPVVTLFCFGYLDNEGVKQGEGDVGVYWSKETGELDTGENGGKYLELDINGSQASLKMGTLWRSFGGMVLLIKDDTKVQDSLTPWFPLTGV